MITTAALNNYCFLFHQIGEEYNTEKNEEYGLDEIKNRINKIVLNDVNVNNKDKYDPDFVS